MSSANEKLVIQYPNFRSSTYKYDLCVADKSSMKCDDCRVQIISDRFLGGAERFLDQRPPGYEFDWHQSLMLLLAH